MKRFLLLATTIAASNAHAQSEPTPTWVRLVMGGPTYPTAELTFPSLTPGKYSLIGPGGGPADGNLDETSNPGSITSTLPFVVPQLTSSAIRGQFGGIYGTLVLGSGYGAQVEKTVSDATPVLVLSQNTATTGTGDYLDLKDAAGTIHQLVDHNLGIHGPVNGVTLSSTGAATQYLDGTGHYSMPPSNGGITGLTIGKYPIATSATSIGDSKLDDTSNSGNLSVHEGIVAYGNINAFPISPATPDLNYGSNSIVLGASLYDLGPTNTYWTMDNEIGSGSTPDTTLHIQVPSGGTPGNKLVQIDAPLQAYSATLQNGSTLLTLQADGTNGGHYGATFPAYTGWVPFTQGPQSISTGHLVTWDGLYLADGGAPTYSFCPAGQPTMTIGAGAGSGASASPMLGSNCDFQMQILTGNSPASQGNIAQITFANPFPSYVGCQAQPAQNAKGNHGWLGNGGADGVWLSPTKNILYVNAGVTPLDALSNFTLYIHCGGN